MRLLVELEVDDGHPNAVLLRRVDVAPPYDGAVEEKTVTAFVARLALTLLQEGEARVLRFTTTNGRERR